MALFRIRENRYGKEGQPANAFVSASNPVDALDRFLSHHPGLDKVSIELEETEFIDSFSKQIEPRSGEAIFDSAEQKA